MGNFYTISDYWGRKICLNPDGWLEPKLEHSKYSNIVIFISSKNRNIGYLISENQKKITCANDPFSEYIYTFNIYYNNDNSISFSSSNDSRFLTSNQEGWLTLEANDLQDWERFRLHEIDYTQITKSDYISSTVQSIEKFLEKYDLFEKIIAKNEKKEIVLGFFANIRNIPQKKLERICACISVDSDWIDVICEQDASIWSLYGLEPLTSWLNNGRIVQINSNVIGKDFDFLSEEIVPHDGYGTRPSSAVEIIVRTIRAQVEPSHNFCVLATARNEGIYLAEWIAYYKSIGFDNAFIYINDCVDNSKEILSALKQQKYVEFFETISSEGVNVQGKAYAHALSFLPQILDYRWVLVVDLDELFVYDKKQFQNLISYFNFLEKKQVDSVAFDWINIGSNKQLRWSEKAYFDRFSNQGFLENEKIKTIFRPAKAAKSYPHFPVEFDNYSFIRRNSTGNLLRTRLNEEKHGPLGKHHNDSPDSRFAVIYHYYFKSVEEYIWKSARNRGDHPKNTDLLNAAFHEVLVSWFLERFEEEYTETSDKASFPDISHLRENFYLEYEKMLSFSEIKHAITINKDIYRKKIGFLINNILKNKENLGKNQLKMLSMLEDIN
ncbi:glycosyltransferase family 2 protein [Acetobacter persici]|uniref:glycosyltransferase family 2 protein n=1 Tax=Acetobacter persici TaxID=1076596 RepID=UPI001BA9A18C|nr:glycosyltransferase family 2 protein [Acetobacter persici]MBS1000919.1 glycosyltransferase family 2 protein [Acetobacter persici]